MKNVSDKVEEKLETRILFSKTFFFENHAIDKIMGKNIVQPDRP
jgi:hypothetical protein